MGDLYMEAPGSGHASTPSGAAWRSEPAQSPMAGAQPEWEILPGMINPPGWTRTTRESHFQNRPASCVKYIDDSLLIEKINMKRPPLLEEADGTRFKLMNSPKSQDLFRHITRSATLNTKKTGLLCVSGATSLKVKGVC